MLNVQNSVINRSEDANMYPYQRGLLDLIDSLLRTQLIKTDFDISGDDEAGNLNITMFFL